MPKHGGKIEDRGYAILMIKSQCQILKTILSALAVLTFLKMTAVVHSNKLKTT